MEMDIVFISAVHSRCCNRSRMFVNVDASCDANGTQKGRHNRRHQQQQQQQQQQTHHLKND
ncbi:hypothetical protein M5D96_008238 [Drosophila gunungcola]|uniref:Uncharacterized protein n=1 Tax=Drosophila gunungcola TaxID=103775 RepID=A0A9Q0BNV0_9MUSC|nr:hypothetical protein M5D96_008238 [Drosophila gunungcola]